MDAGTTDLAAFVAGLTRCAEPAAARVALTAPRAEVTTATVDDDARVAVLTLAPGVLAEALAPLGTPTQAPAVPSGRGPLAVALYPAGPPAAAAVYGAPLAYAVAVRWPAAGPVGDLRLDAATGRITVCRRTLGPGTTRYAADALGGTWRDMRNGYAWLDVEHEVPGGGTWFVSLSFAGTNLASAHLSYLGPDEPRGWGGWTREREEAARVRHDAWLDAQLGPGPFWRETRHFPWGDVWSGYDERAAGSYVVVSYEVVGNRI